jgi:D-serine dehydratase
MYCLLALFAQCEDIHLEPSALVGFSGLSKLAGVWEKLSISPEQQQHTTHLVWATGGNMVPDTVWQQYYKQGIKLLGSFSP